MGDLGFVFFFLSFPRLVISERKYINRR